MSQAYLNGEEIFFAAVKGDKGDNGLCAPLASFILGGGSGSGHATINIDEKKITFPNDTLIIGNGTYYRLASEKGNNEYIYSPSSLGGTSAVNIVYQISGDAMCAKRFDSKIDVNDEILLCSIRLTTVQNPVSITCPYELIQSGVTYSHMPKSNAFEPMYLAPLIAGYHYKYIEVDSAAGTIKFPDDTLIVNPNRHASTDAITYQLSDAKGNNVCNYKAATTSSAVKIYYDPSTDTLKASIYGYAPTEYGKYILIAVLRTSQKTVASTLPYIFDGLLNGIDYNEYAQTNKNENIRCVNHRGYYEAPENTLSAYKLSKKKGFEYVECDVSFTKDGVPVLLHDATIDRTSNGTGDISDMTLEQARAYDYGSWKSNDYTGEQIPTFEEFIVLCKQLGLKPYIEIKISPMPTAGQVKLLVDIVRRYGMLKNSTWISFNHSLLEYVKQNDPTARLGLVVGGIVQVNLDWVNSVKTEQNDVFIDAEWSTLTGESVELCVNANIPVEVWTINGASEIMALDGYITGFTSDNLIASKVLFDNYID